MSVTQVFAVAQSTPYARLPPVPRPIRLPRLRRRSLTTPDQAAEPTPPEETPAAVTPEAGAEPTAQAETPAAVTPQAETPHAPAPATTESPEPLAASAPDPGEAGARPPWLRPVTLGAGVLVAVGAGLGLGYALFSDEERDPVRLPAVAPTVVIDELPQPASAEEAGPPSLATLNTTRIAGVDPAADAAGVALASYPPSADLGSARLAVIAPAESWQAALAAGSLAAEPLGAPVLLGQTDEIPGFTAEALAALEPTGLKRADDTQIVVIGGVASPGGLKTLEVPGADPAEVAKQIDRARGQLSGREDPAHILVVSSEEAPFAMPAAAWAARSGDPIVFAAGDVVPDATVDVIKRHKGALVYVLGPESVIGKQALKRLEKVAGRAIRVGDEDPVSNAIAFARFLDGDFGWNIVDPGHGFSIANIDRPADAGAGALLAAGGKPGPLLVTDSATEIPEQLGSFLLDTKPGFTDDPTRAVYNHIWLLGDAAAISLPFQAEVDRLTRLERVSSGSGNGILDGVPSAPEPEPPPRKR